jgi:hypothetical protein
LFVFGLFSRKSSWRPWTQFFSNRWMERLQKCVQVNGEYIEWAKRTQYFEIDFNCEIRLCYTWRGAPYRILISLRDSRLTGGTNKNGDGSTKGFSRWNFAGKSRGE